MNTHTVPEEPFAIRLVDEGQVLVRVRVMRTAPLLPQITSPSTKPSPLAVCVLHAVYVTLTQIYSG